MFGQNPRWNLDIVLDNPSGTDDCDHLPEYATDLISRLEKAYHIVCEHLQVAAEFNRRSYDKSVRKCDFEPGDRVRIYVPKNVKGRSQKLQSYYKDCGTIV